jgi:hypothetical protein
MMTPLTKAIMRLTEHVTVAETDSGGLLFHTGTGKSFAVNWMGLLIWRALESGSGRDAVLSSVEARFPDIEKRRLVEDVDGFLRELVTRRLLES